MSEATETKRPGYGEGRQALLDAVVRVVAQKGLRGLTLRAVAAEAGVSHGLVVRHFGNRDRLIHEALLNAGSESIGETLTPNAAPALGIGLGEFLTGTAELQAFQWEAVLESRRNPDMSEDGRELYAHYFEATSTMLEAEGFAHDEGMTRLVFAALDGLALQQLLFEDPEATDQAIEALRKLLIADRKPSRKTVAAGD